jgi:hypothetical protein
MIEKLCKNLIATYNTNILDSESDIIQKEFLDVSLRNRDNTTNKGKKVLMELICNHYDESVNKPTAEFIGGPKTLTIHWHPVYKKMIYIFGEWHSDITDCEKFEKDANTILIEDYLYDLMLTTDVFLDIYFEFIPYIGGRYSINPYADGRSRELFKKFQKCIQYNTRSDKKCQLARVHYFDIRKNYFNEENKIDILWVKKELQFLCVNLEESKMRSSAFKLFLKNNPKVITILKELLNDTQTVCKFMEKQLEENFHTKKELDKIIDNQHLKMLILNFYKKLLSQTIRENYTYLKPNILKLLNYEKESDDELSQAMQNIDNWLMFEVSYFADVYLLARIFKNFDISEMEKKAYKGSTDQPIHASNIIIYCGDLHAYNYRNFLSSIGFKDIDHTGNLTEKVTYKIPNTPKNCLDMRKIKQPFFSYSSKEKESPNSSPVNPSETIIIQKRCCDRPTQFPSRMVNCEGTGHSTAAGLSYLASFLTNQDSNLDAIIEIRNGKTVYNEPNFERVEYLDNENPYISDHNGIVLYLSTNHMVFNIISSNLEGLCRQTKNDSHNRINMITNYFKDVIQKGSILVCQEIVLQKLAKTKLSMDEEWVDVVGNEILSKLKSINDNLFFLSDNYTGGIFYDSSVWKLEKTINISRLYDKKLWAKFSNAYLFHCISTKCVFWVVNIHLKAFAPGSFEHSRDLLNSNKYVNKAHIIELEHIIAQLLLESNYSRIPIYLCGDYNNNSSKDILVKEAIEKYMNASYPQIDYIVQVI